MRYFALACDYDGTLADEGIVSPTTLAAVQRLKDSGRKPILVTGRQLADLIQVFPDHAIFDRIVADNGAVLYSPASRATKILGEPPLPGFLEALRRRGVPFTVGQVIVATVEPYDVAVLQVIKELGLELHVIYNKGSVMILPSGLNKSTGLLAALSELGVPSRQTVGIGDGAARVIHKPFLHGSPLGGEAAAFGIRELPNLKFMDSLLAMFELALSFDRAALFADCPIVFRTELRFELFGTLLQNNERGKYDGGERDAEQHPCCWCHLKSPPPATGS